MRNRQRDEDMDLSNTTVYTNSKRYYVKHLYNTFCTNSSLCVARKHIHLELTGYTGSNTITRLRSGHWASHLSAAALRQRHRVRNRKGGRLDRNKSTRVVAVGTGNIILVVK